MSNHHLKNKELSAKAKGVLSTMLALPDGWDYSIAGLTALFRDGKDSIMAALDELEREGYIYMDKQRDEKGRFFTNYDVYEIPNRENRCGKSESENPPQLNTNILSIDRLSTNTIEDNSSRIINNTSNNISSSKEKRKKKEYDLSFVNIAFEDVFKEWLEYKKSRSESYKDQHSLEVCYRRLLTLSNNDPRTAQLIIEEAIANNYKGFFAPKKQQNNYGSSTNQTQQSRNRFCDLAAAIKANGGVF